MDDFKVGDKVQISDEYLSHYPMWDVAGKIFLIAQVERREMLAGGLAAIDLARYQARYGKLTKFPLITLFIKLNGQEFMLSQFGVA